MRKCKVCGCEEVIKSKTNKVCIYCPSCGYKVIGATEKEAVNKWNGTTQFDKGFKAGLEWLRKEIKKSKPCVPKMPFDDYYQGMKDAYKGLEITIKAKIKEV